MAETIFFSWQADTTTACGRNLIERALEIALRQIKSEAVIDEAVRDSLAVDKDTKGVPGSPPIVETILAKIDSAAVFVPDLTFVGTRIDGRPTPNPNVLIEYGWALKAHGHGHMVPVMNTAFGEPNDANLPFDLKHLRYPITYYCPDDANDEDRKAARDGLAKALASAIRSVVSSESYRSARAKSDAPFVGRQPTDGGGRFRAKGEALGVFDWDGEVKEVHLCDWPLMWFRMMPRRTVLEEFPVTRLRSEVRPSGATNRLQTFHVVFGQPLSVRGPDGYGTWDPAPGNPEGDRIPASGAAFAFSTGELWTVEGRSLRNAKSKNYIPLNEDTWIRLLTEQAEFLRDLGLGSSFQWVAGMEDLKGRGLFLRPDLYKPYGASTLDIIEVRGTFAVGGDPATALEPFFARVYDACGLKRSRG